LGAFKKLSNVTLNGTKVTQHGVNQLKAALPSYSVEWVY